MLNRKQQENNFISSTQKTFTILNSLRSTITESSFKIHKDGFSFKGYSVRLSNFSLSHIPTHCFWFAGWTAGIGESMGRVIGLTAPNWLTHYRILEEPYSFAINPLINSFMNLFSQNNCSVIYDESRQDEYWQMNYKTIFLLENENSQYKMKLCRGILQPILNKTEDCLKDLMNQTYASFLRDEHARNLQKEQEFHDFLSTIAQYVGMGCGLFAGGYGMYKLYQWNQNRNRPLSFQERLEAIHYDGEIPIEFIDPILKVIINDPVKLNRRYIHDRASLAEWWLHTDRKTSPLSPTEVITSFESDNELKKQIEDFVSHLEAEYILRTGTRLHS